MEDYKIPHESTLLLLQKYADYIELLLSEIHRTRIRALEQMCSLECGGVNTTGESNDYSNRALTDVDKQIP